MSTPSFGDISKAANDLLNRDFFHVSAGNLEVKSTAPNGVSFNVKGKSAHEGSTSGSMEAKMKHADTGLTFTQGWSTANSLDTKVELEDKLAKGVKWELLTNFVPHSQALGAKTNLHYKLPNFHGRAFVDLLKGPTATIDAVVGQNGFLVGAETGYDVQKAAITRYSAAVGYVGGQYSATVAAANNFSLFSAAYYHRVNSEVEAGAKAVWDSKAGNNVGLEIASKYRLDPSSWAKAKMNDRGVAAISYEVLLRPGFKLGLGTSFDTQKLNEGTHKVGASLTFTG